MPNPDPYTDATTVDIEIDVLICKHMRAGVPAATIAVILEQLAERVWHMDASLDRTIYDHRLVDDSVTLLQ